VSSGRNNGRFVVVFGGHKHGAHGSVNDDHHSQNGEKRGGRQPRVERYLFHQARVETHF